MEGAAETVSLFWVGGSFSLACRQVRGGGGGCRTPVSPGGGGIGRQPVALPQHCCSALMWAPVPRICCDLLVLTNHVRIAKKAGRFIFAGSACSDPATARWTGKVGAVLRGRHGLLGHFLRFVHCFRYVLSSLDAVDSPGGPSGLCCC